VELAASPLDEDDREVIRVRARPGRWRRWSWRLKGPGNWRKGGLMGVAGDTSTPARGGLRAAGVSGAHRDLDPRQAPRGRRSATCGRWSPSGGCRRW